MSLLFEWAMSAWKESRSSHNPSSEKLFLQNIIHTVIAHIFSISDSLAAASHRTASNI